MCCMATEGEIIREQIWRTVMPDERDRAFVDLAVDGGPALPEFLRRLGADVSDSWDQLAALSAEYRILVEDIEAAIRVLGPRGWAVTPMSLIVLRQAVEAAEGGRESEADDLLAAEWDGDDGATRLSRICAQVGVLGATDPELHRLFHERARLVGLARDHHLAGRYDASVPLLQAHMEGIVMDVTGGSKFFTQTREKADLVDPQRLVGLEACLASLQKVYGTSVKETQTRGSLSRHGVLHGRELAYDTRVNSAKTWSVFAALVEWAQPKALAVVRARKAERQAAAAGTQALDDRGRRLDNREFSETRDALRTLWASAMGWHRQRGRFRPDLVGGVYRTSDFTRKGLPVDHAIQQWVSEDGQEVMYWRTTASGWTLGLALSAEGDRFGEYLFSAPKPPSGPPSEGESGWGGLFETPPDWI